MSFPIRAVSASIDRSAADRYVACTLPCRGAIMQFLNRSQAGRKLAEKLLHYAGRDDVIVLALPRGGVPVGYEVARKLGAPLDVFLVRKLGVPGYEELAMGAIASNGVQILNDSVLRKLQLSNDEIEDVAATERR